MGTVLVAIGTAVMGAGTAATVGAIGTGIVGAGVLGSAAYGAASLFGGGLSSGGGTQQIQQIPGGGQQPLIADKQTPQQAGELADPLIDEEKEGKKRQRAAAKSRFKVDLDTPSTTGVSVDASKKPTGLQI